MRLPCCMRNLCWHLVVQRDNIENINFGIYAYIFEQISRNEQLKHKKKQRQQSWPFKVSPRPLYIHLSPSFLRVQGKHGILTAMKQHSSKLGQRPFQLLHGPTAISLNDAVNVQCLAAKPFDVTWSWYIPTYV